MEAFHLPLSDRLARAGKMDGTGPVLYGSISGHPSDLLVGCLGCL